MVSQTLRFFLMGVLCAGMVSFALAHDGPGTFQQSKIELRDSVYHDRYESDFGTVYCGCHWSWTTRSGGETELNESCDYQTHGNAFRARRIEYEHIVPASMKGGDRPCWLADGRSYCASEDPEFSAMYTDLHNLTVSIGEVNAERSNHPFGEVKGNEQDYGGCQSKVDEQANVFEPRDEAKGFVARATFYMVDRYDLRDEALTPDKERILIRWDREHPPSDWERERNQRIKAIQGNENPFISGERTWEKGFEPFGAGLAVVEGRYEPAANDDKVETDKAIIGNQNSMIYHLPEGCPSYSRVGEQNREEFESASAAEDAGYRKAGNCR